MAIKLLKDGDVYLDGDEILAVEENLAPIVTTINSTSNLSSIIFNNIPMIPTNICICKHMMIAQSNRLVCLQKLKDYSTYTEYVSGNLSNYSWREDRYIVYDESAKTLKINLNTLLDGKYFVTFTFD